MAASGTRHGSVPRQCPWLLVLVKGVAGTSSMAVMKSGRMSSGLQEMGGEMKVVAVGSCSGSRPLKSHHSTSASRLDTDCSCEA